MMMMAKKDAAGDIISYLKVNLTLLATKEVNVKPAGLEKCYKKQLEITNKNPPGCQETCFQF